MIRGLTVVAVGGALLCVFCVGVSGALSPHKWHIPSTTWTIDDEGEGPVLKLSGNEPIITRTLEWDGGDSLSFDVPAKITFTQGPVTKITLTGPDAEVNHVTMHRSTIGFDRTIHGLGEGHTMTIEVTSPSLHDFELNSAQSLDIRNLTTDTLRVQIDGAGKVDAAGTAHTANITINGAGDADFTALALTDAHVEIDGLGHVIMGPTGDAHVEINGAGKVSLLKRPAHLDEDVNGAGSITQPDAPAGTNL